MHIPTLLLTALAFVPQVLTHGYMKEIIVDGKSYPGWVPFSDPYITPPPVKKFQWDQWGSPHSGPVMTYIARYPNGGSSFKGNSGNVWVKIDQMGYDPRNSPPWGSDMLASQGASWIVTIPASLAKGEYLLRHEILGLHVAGQRMGAQFYPSCAQITVTGGGSTGMVRKVVDAA
ncbi:glycosyl hydrolase family 61-domain-containing protein [Kalaharituber pfeilii]|nr:glycosyl hydrolase family 61-domain-containing protein [Kalaharituber pfeilii]